MLGDGMLQCDMQQSCDEMLQMVDDLELESWSWNGENPAFNLVDTLDIWKH